MHLSLYVAGISFQAATSAVWAFCSVVTQELNNSCVVLPASSPTASERLRQNFSKSILGRVSSAAATATVMKSIVAAERIAFDLCSMRFPQCVDRSGAPEERSLGNGSLDKRISEQRVYRFDLHQSTDAPSGTPIWAVSASSRSVLRRTSVPGELFRLMIDHVFWNDLGLEREELRVRMIDGDTHPMGVRIAKGLDAGEVFEHPVGLLAVERLVDTMKM
jgi:hypothetical protein